MLKRTKLTVVLLLASALVACSSQPKVSLQQAAKPSANAGIDAIFADAESAVNQAINNDVANYSKVFLPEAKQGLQKLAAMKVGYNPNKTGFFSSGYSLAEIKEQSAQVKNDVRRAELAKQLITTQLKEILDNQAYVKTIDISRHAQRYKTISEDIKDLFLAVEKAGSVEKYQTKKAAILQDMRNFEIAVMETKYHTPQLTKLSLLEQKKIPKSYLRASSQLTDLMSVISQDPRNIQAMEAAQAKAIKQVSRAKSIHDEVVWIEENDKGIEQVVLKYHKPLDTAFPELLKTDHSELPFESQILKYSVLVSGMQERIQGQVKGKDEQEIKTLADKLTAEKLVGLEAELKEKYAEEFKLKEQQKAAELALAMEQKEQGLNQENEKMVAFFKEQQQALETERDQLKLEVEKLTMQLTEAAAMAETIKQQPAPAPIAQAEKVADQEPAAKKVEEKVVAKAEPKPVKESAPAVKVKTVIVKVPEYQESGSANDTVDFDFNVN